MCLSVLYICKEDSLEKGENLGCRQTGQDGRTLHHDIVVATPEIRECEHCLGNLHQEAGVERGEKSADRVAECELGSRSGGEMCAGNRIIKRG